MTDRIKEIRARLDALTGPPTLSAEYPRTILMSFEMRDLFASDIAWLLRELDRWMHVAKNDLYGMCWCDAPRPDCCECPGARGDIHRGEVMP